MAASPLDKLLPSTIEETLRCCPRERESLPHSTLQKSYVGYALQTGVGKSSLVANIFNIKKEDIDIAHDRAGKADINRGYTSQDNPRFILHDSQGFEPGNRDNWNAVEEFISYRICIETPRTGSRLTQTADERVINLADSSYLYLRLRLVNIPTILVLTKYDILFNEFYQKAVRRPEPGTNDSNFRTEAEKDAGNFLNVSIKELQQHVNHIGRRRSSISHLRKPLQIEIVAVSIEEKFPNYVEMLENLTKTTRKCLRTTETLVPWAVAQRIDPKQKVNTCIDEGFKKYWKDLGKSVVFKDQMLLNCLWRIHLDIVKVWNFKDPSKLLSDIEFRVRMLELVQPFIPQPNYESIRDKLPFEVLASMVDNLFPLASVALEAASLTAVAIEFLIRSYQALPPTAACLEAYIVDLTLVLHELFAATLQTGRQEPLSKELISAVLQRYKDTRSQHVHELIRNDCHTARDALTPKKHKGNVGDLIRKQLGMNTE
ncbi:hypothetical protein C0995_003400 [Termitomyces sp. Mi166|nr:hypothetical protein C0995_003400 [Termitomyces sp. Mi166\